MLFASEKPPHAVAKAKRGERKAKKDDRHCLHAQENVVDNGGNDAGEEAEDH